MNVKLTQTKNADILKRWFVAKLLPTPTLVAFKNGPTSASFSFMFGLFKQQYKFLQQNKWEK